MKKTKERRKLNRWQVAVLVQLTIPKLGDEQIDLEMWARDVSEDGLKLELTPGLAISRFHENSEKTKSPLRFEDIEFHKGLKVKLHDLFYDDEGSPFIEGEVSWVKKTPSRSWMIGLRFSDKKKQAEVFLGAFKDFLKIVKNPSMAIERASRR